jgi:hypothetical protein
MFDPTSRYANLETLTHTATDSDGEPRTIRYRSLGDPLLFWRIADSNNALVPETLCDEPGTRITISLPSA